jgi:4-amino-4-deoxy-L-arabinose transferase-like glycosyltransferase
MPRKYLLIAATALLIACWNSFGFHQGDEHFQLLEFAAWKLGLMAQEDLTWEFAERMRPATQPAIVYAIYKVWAVFGEVNPYHFAFLLRLLSAGGFLLLAVKVWERYGSRMPTARLTKWLALGLLFTWCSVYSGIRFSGENWAGMALAAGFLLYPVGKLTGDHRIFSTGREGNNIAAFGAGLLFGLAFLFRYQVAIMVVGFGAWLLFIRRDNWKRIVLVVLGGLVALAVGTLLDGWFYGEWVIAPWHYVRSNLIEGKAATFGSAPWWDYFRMVFERGVPPLGLLYIVAPLWFAWRYRRDPITWMMVPFLLVHFVLSRKDARFLFPLLPYLPVMIMAGAVALRQHYGDGFFDRKWISRGVKLFWGINLAILLTVLVRPMISEVKVNKYVYDNYIEPVTLFADNKHIYTYANLTMHFYQRPGKVTIYHTETREEWPACATPVCLYSRHAKVADPPAGAKLVYTTRPVWADELGLKGLLDGMTWWWVWELER